MVVLDELDKDADFSISELWFYSAKTPPPDPEDAKDWDLDPDPKWAGTWETNFFGRLTVSLRRQWALGDYSGPVDGRIFGKVEGEAKQLFGTWHTASGENGELKLQLDSTGDRFTGLWRDGPEVPWQQDSIEGQRTVELK